MRKRNAEKGFSLIELLLVCVIIGVIAAIAVPAFQKGIWAAENGRAFAILRTIHSTEVDFYVQNNRFGRLPEINARLGSGAGTTVGDRVIKGTYTFEMVPGSPTDADLRDRYVVTATRDVSGDVFYKYELTESGRINQIFPDPGTSPQN